MSPGFCFSRPFSPSPLGRARGHQGRWPHWVPVGIYPSSSGLFFAPNRGSLFNTHQILFLKPWLGLFHMPPEDHSQLPAEAELAARHLLSIVGFKELILGHSEGGFPITSDAFPHEGRDAVVHDCSGYGAVVGHGVLLHLFERCALDNVIHSLLRQGAPYKLQDLLNLPFGVLEQWRGSSGRFGLLAEQKREAPF